MRWLNRALPGMDKTVRFVVSNITDAPCAVYFEPWGGAVTLPGSGSHEWLTIEVTGPHAPSGRPELDVVEISYTDGGITIGVPWGHPDANEVKIWDTAGNPVQI